MKRNTLFSYGLSALAASATLIGIGGTTQAADAKKPNIIYFHVDNTSVGDWGCYGGAYALGAKTPNVDHFASEALKFSNYNVESQCTPSRAALMTGRYSVRTGCITALPGSGLVAWEVTIGDRLKELGYSSACLGKWHMGETIGRLPTDHGFDYWLGLPGTWDVATWPDDPWFKKEKFEPDYILESKAKGDLQHVKVLDLTVRRDIDLEFLEKAGHWMEDAKAKDKPFFIYFNHSSIHFPVLPRKEYEHSSNGGAVADCVQEIDGDFKILMDKLDALGLSDNTIVIFAGDNGRDTSFQAPGNRGAPGPWKGGYFSTWEGNNRTAGIIRWPGKIQPRASDEMMHVTDWFPTLMNLVGHPELVPTDRVLDGVDQSAFILGKQEHSNRDSFMMFFDSQLVGMRYKNFKVLTYKVEDGALPIEKLAIPNVMNLTVNPDENTPYDYEEPSSWVLYKVFMPKARELEISLKKDSVPFGAPLDFDPYKK